MREQITIDVDRTRGSRHVRVRVFVAARPGEAGVAYTVGTVELLPEQQLGQAAGEYLGHEIVTALQNSVGLARAAQLAERGRREQEELPF